MDYFPRHQPESPSNNPETGSEDQTSKTRTFRWPAPGTAVVMAAAIVATFWSWTNPQDAYAALYSGGVDPWLGKNLHALVSSALLHGDFTHLVFNLWWTWELGSFVERRWGAFRYLALVLVSAVLGSVAQLAISGEIGIGLSGVVYAIFGTLLAQRRHDSEVAAVLPVSRVGVFIGWFILCIVMTKAGVMNVANAAHAAGLFVGLWHGFVNQNRSLRALRILVAILTLAASAGVFYWAPWQAGWHAARLHKLSEAKETKAYHEAAEEYARRFPNDPWSVSYTAWSQQNTELPRILKLRENGDLDAFRKAAQVFANRYPESPWTLRYLAWDAQSRNDYANVKAAIEKLKQSENVEVLNNLAWLLATAPDTRLRDGQTAIRLAELGCAKTEWKQSAVINTLAAALAEVGHFEEAVATNKKAAAIAETPSLYDRYTEAFAARQPWREDQPLDLIGP